MSADHVEYVKSWLEESGYGLELRLASALRETGGFVGQSIPYSDPLEGKLREADLIYVQEVPMDSRQSARVNVVFECKSSKKNPWVVFDVASGHAHAAARTQAIILAEDAYVRERANELLSDDAIFKYEWFGHAVVSARKGEDTEGLNTAQRAVRQVISATYGMVDFYQAIPGVKVFIPAVVTSAPIVTCRLAPESGEIQVATTEYAQVRAMPEGKKRSLVVHVMSEKYASTHFAETAKRLARTLRHPSE
ncbi:hypothetical protein [Streptomyces sp. SID13031]|uniref:hypothetical protein n=1 Tax=Streptomyces sp. SID13031 TaxID=2706046 RepID=UPI0013C848C3|nr:hypothetical protein [Streptomyces sp. SID13031]NEA34844.1 hypothetical protein [Streptomyces sp. SID13031]